MRRVVVACVVLIGSAAAADDDFMRYGKPLRVSARLDGDTARFSVRYMLRVDKPSEMFDVKLTSYRLPERGAVSGAVVTEGGKRRVMELVSAEEASSEWAELFERPPARARRWAVYVAVNETRVQEFSMEVAAARQSTVAVDVEISAPTCFHRDARYTAVPEEWAPRIASIRAPSREIADLEVACGDGLAWVKFPAPVDHIGAFANRVSLGKTQVVKVELDLAARLSQVPADLATVIVVDASRSMSPDQLDMQRDTIAAYLRAAPGSRVQVIAYSRGARALLPSWMHAKQAAVRLDRELRAVSRSNGSNIDEGLREAGKWLDQISGTRRIVLFTDEHLTSRSENTRAIDDAVPPNTLVHVVSFGGTGFQRDDDAALARVAASTRGMSVRGGSVDSETPKLDATLLVRPITLDRVIVRTPGWQQLGNDENACSDTDDGAHTSLEEGSACLWWGKGDAVASPFTIEGFLWGDRVTRVLRADLDRARDVAREVSLLHILDEDLQKLAERAARVVNSVWSLYVEWGGDGGYSDSTGFGSAGFGMSCFDCDFGEGGHGFGFGGASPGPSLAPELARIARTCKPTQAVDIEVETTFEEIVDVEVQAASADLRTCVEEALWNAWLVAPAAARHTRTSVHVKPE